LRDRLSAPDLVEGTRATVDRVATHELDPYAAADELLGRVTLPDPAP
jgi:hypothetical protein